MHLTERRSINTPLSGRLRLGNAFESAFYPFGMPHRLGDVFKSAFYLQEYVFVDATSKAGKDVLNLEMQGKVGTAWPDSMKELLGPQGLLFQDGDAHTRLRK